MPIAELEVPEISESIARPIAIQIIRQICEHTRLPKDLPIRFLGGGGALPIVGSTLDDKGAIENRLPTDLNIKIDVTEEYDEDFAGTGAILRQDQSYIFYDKDLFVFMKPVFQRLKTTINVEYTAPDKTSAEAWVRTMKRRAEQHLVQHLHHVDYHYPIPLECMAILLEVHRLRELKGGYGEDYGTYLMGKFDKQVTSIANQAGNNAIFVMRQQQARIIGNYDFVDQPPRPDKNSETGAYLVSFSYSFKYDRPETVVIEYPIVIHNSILKYYSKEKIYEESDVKNRGSVSTEAARFFTPEYGMNTIRNRIPGVAIPWFDDWLPNENFPSTENIFRILNEVVQDDPKALVNLTQLGYIHIAEKALNYIRENPISITQYRESVFVLRVFKGRTPLDMDALVINNELDIRTIEDMDMRKTYRIVLDVMYDLAMLSPRALVRLCHHGEFAIELIMAIDPTAPLPLLLPNGTINLNSMRRCIDYLNLNKRYSYKQGEPFFARVGTFSIVSNRSE